MVMGEPVGVVGEGGLFRQDRQPGEQGAGRVVEQIIDVGDPPGGGELEGQQGQQPRCGWDDAGAGVAGLAGQGGQAEGDQVGDREQQPGQPGAGGGGEGAEVDDPGRGEGGVPPGGGRAEAGRGLGVAQQPAEAFLGQDLPDPGAVQRSALGREPGADLVDRQALAAQLDHPAAGGVLLRRALAAGPARLGEQRQLARAEVAHQRGQRRAGVAEPRGGLTQRRSFIQVGTDRLIPPLVHLCRAAERLPARARGRFRCHTADLPDTLPMGPGAAGGGVSRRERARSCLSRTVCPA